MNIHQKSENLAKLSKLDDKIGVLTHLLLTDHVLLTQKVTGISQKAADSVETVSNYQSHLLSNLKLGLQSTLSRIGKDMDLLSNLQLQLSSREQAGSTSENVGYHQN